MAADKKDKKDKGESFTQKPYYYDRETTDASIQKKFGDMLSKLTGVLKDLKDELAKPGGPADLEIKKKD